MAHGGLIWDHKSTVAVLVHTWSTLFLRPSKQLKKRKRKKQTHKKKPHKQKNKLPKTLEKYFPYFIGEKTQIKLFDKAKEKTVGEL